LIELN